MVIKPINSIKNLTPYIKLIKIKTKLERIKNNCQEIEKCIFSLLKSFKIIYDESTQLKKSTSKNVEYNGRYYEEKKKINYYCIQVNVYFIFKNVLVLRIMFSYVRFLIYSNI